MNVDGQVLAARAIADRFYANEAETSRTLVLLQGNERVPVLDCERAGELAAEVLVPAGHVVGRDLFTLEIDDGTDGETAVRVEVPGPDPMVPSAPAPGGTAPHGTGSGPGAPTDPERERRELLEDIYRFGVSKPGQWHSFIQGFLRRNHVDRLANLTVEALRNIYNDAAYFARQRGQR